MASTSTDDLERALAKRVRSQALYHLVGKRLDIISMLRFKAAGVWDGKIRTELPSEVAEVIQDESHPKREVIPTGPLVVYLDDEKKIRHIINVAEQLLNADQTIRLAALNHFKRGCEVEHRWLSPYTENVLNGIEANLLGTNEELWLKAGLDFYDVLRNDINMNVAGLDQSLAVDFDEGSTDYMQRLLRPELKSLDQFRPPIWDPKNETNELQSKFQTWASTCETIDQLLDAYQRDCGYLPLAEPFSAGRLIKNWLELHESSDIWKSLWSWADRRQSVAGYYHVCSALIELPHLIDEKEIDRLLKTAEQIIGGRDATKQISGSCQLLTGLTRHYQFHNEAVSVGVSGNVAAAYSCWLAHEVARRFGMEASDIEHGMTVAKHQLRLSIKRWSFARSRTEPSSIRNIILWSDFLWAGSLLITTSRNWRGLRDKGAPAEFKRLLMEEVIRMQSFAIPSHTGEASAVFAFEQSLEPDDLDLPPEGEGDAVQQGVHRMLRANKLLLEDDAVNQLFEGLERPGDDFALFSAIALRSQQFATGIKQIPTENLLDETWRQKVFQDSSDRILDPLIIFLTEWHLQQDDEWSTRLPHLLALECERAATEDRRRFLFAAVLVSSLTADIASPVIRLLVGSNREFFKTETNRWLQQLRAVADLSEPWLAMRLRGLLGSIDQYIH